MARPCTYAEVDRRVKFLRESGASPARVATARSEMWAMVGRHYKRAWDNKCTVAVPNRERLDAMRADAAAAFGIEPDDLYGRNRSMCRVNARRAFAVAARKVGYSTTELAVYLRRPGRHSSIVHMTVNADAVALEAAEAILKLDSERETA